MNRRGRKELIRLQDELANAIPGSQHYKDLLEDLKNHGVAMKVNETSLIPGVKNETLAIGAIGAAEIGLLAKIQDLKFMPKNLFSMLPILRFKL